MDKMEKAKNTTLSKKVSKSNLKIIERERNDYL
jgi:hypothetical protein